MTAVGAKYCAKYITWSAEDTATAIEAAIPFYDELAKVSPEAIKMIEIIRKQMKELGTLK